MRRLKLIALIGLFLIASPSYAAGSFLQASGLLANTTAASASASFGTSCLGSYDLLGIVAGNGGTVTDNWTSVTWGTQPMIKVATEKQIPGDRWIYEWYVLNPPPGNQTITVTGSVSDHIGFSAACYGGVASFDATGNANSSATTASGLTMSLTTTQSNELIIGNIANAIDGGCTLAETTTGNNRLTNGAVSVIDNTVGSPGSVSIVCTGGTSTGYAGLVGGFIPTVTPSPNGHSYFSNLSNTLFNGGIFKFI